jgi:hypothetical protein
LWSHRDLVAETFSFEDLLDAHELLDYKAENERRIELFKQEQRVRQQ